MVNGINFNNAVDVVTVPKGNQFVQYQISGSPAGNYFAPIGDGCGSVSRPEFR